MYQFLNQLNILKDLLSQENLFSLKQKPRQNPFRHFGVFYTDKMYVYAITSSQPKASIIS
jgi:hypothetical protein